MGLFFVMVDYEVEDKMLVGSNYCKLFDLVHNELTIRVCMDI